MTDHESEFADDGVDGDIDDVHEELPVSELVGLEVPSHDPLAARVVSSIHRRETAGQLATLSWSGFGAVLLEVFRFGFNSRRPDSTPTRRPRE